MSTTNTETELRGLPTRLISERDYPHWRPGFANFVAEARVGLEGPRVSDVREKLEEEDRSELLDALHMMMQDGYREPLSDFELIGFVWVYLGDRWDDSLLNAAEKLWLEFEES